MAETTTAREASQRFFRLLRDVAAGKEYIITCRGRPVATLAPVTPQPGTPQPGQARADRRATGCAGSASPPGSDQ